MILSLLRYIQVGGVGCTVTVTFALWMVVYAPEIANRGWMSERKSASIESGFGNADRLPDTTTKKARHHIHEQDMSERHCGRT